MPLTDKARSILTFAAYHQLASGEIVRDVVLEDGAGHRADPDGVEEMVQAGFLTVENGRGRLTDEGEAMLEKTVEALRGVN
jgi:hypothetical protein